MKLKVGGRCALTSKRTWPIAFNVPINSERYLNLIFRPVFQEVVYEKETQAALTQNPTYDTTAMR